MYTRHGSSGCRLAIPSMHVCKRTVLCDFVCVGGWCIDTRRKGARKDHAFLVNSIPGGTSDRLDRFSVDAKTTFRKLRRLVEVWIRGTKQ